MVADNFQQNQTHQVGYAMIDMEDSNPAWSQAMEAEATRLWARFFSSDNPSHLHISIPADWANFFITQLLNQTSFTWTKQLLSSKLLLLISNLQDGTIDFSIPTKCPDSNFSCLSISGEEHQSLQGGSCKDIPPKKRSFRSSTPVVESEVRRSPRLKTSSNGFKPKGCNDVKCLGYSTEPPLLRKDVIRKIAKDFCKMNESEFSDDILQMKKVKT